MSSSYGSASYLAASSGSQTSGYCRPCASSQSAGCLHDLVSWMPSARGVVGWRSVDRCRLPDRSCTRTEILILTGATFCERPPLAGNHVNSNSWVDISEYWSFLSCRSPYVASAEVSTDEASLRSSCSAELHAFSRIPLCNRFYLET